MEPREIAIVLARASDLHVKINDAIARQHDEEKGASYHREDDDDTEGEEDKGRRISPGAAQKMRVIRDSLQALEANLEALRDLQKRQKDERDELLIELEECRKTLIRKLREYNGSEWDIIQEAYAFVREPVQRKDDLMLPPYQSPVPEMSSLRERETQTSFRNRFLSAFDDSPPLTIREEEDGDKQKQLEAVSELDSENAGGQASGIGGVVLSVLARAGQAVGFTAKTAVLVVSVIAILTSFSQLQPNLKKKLTDRAVKLQPTEDGPKLQGQWPSSSSSSHHMVQDEVCPPGKVLLVHDGVQKCFVKERIEAPFKEVIRQPDASYGCG